MSIATYDVLNPGQSIIWIGTNKLAPNVGYKTISVVDGSAEETELLRQNSIGGLQIRGLTPGNNVQNVSSLLITDVTAAQLAALVAASGLSLYSLYRVGSTVYIPLTTSTYRSLTSASDVISTVSFSASTLIKSGPAKVYSLVMVSGTATITLRNGTSGGAPALTGWSALSLSVNTPYAAATIATDSISGLYADVSGTGSFVLFYQ